MMKILVDADACPVKAQIVQSARKRGIAVVMVCDNAHELRDDYSQIITVDRQADSADYAIMGLVERGDIVVTQDYGLAAMVLGKGARALHQNGFEYTDQNIERLLMERHLGQKTRRAGGRQKGPAKRTKADDAAFVDMLEQMLTPIEAI